MKKLLVFSVLFFILVIQVQESAAISLRCGESSEGQLICLDNSHPSGVYIFNVEKAKGCFSTSTGENLKVFCAREGMIVQLVDHVLLDKQINLEINFEEVK